MRREEPRTGRIADFEFEFWECWQFEDDLPEVLKRHWFRSDTGLEAPTYDHMLQMLYRQKMGLPVVPAIASEPQLSCTSEWDKRTSHTVRVRGEEVLITIVEHFNEASGGAPVRTEVRNGAAVRAAGRLNCGEKSGGSEGENEEVIRKMLRIDHGRSGISCGSKMEIAGFTSHKFFR